MDYQIDNPVKPRMPVLKDLKPGDMFVFETGNGALYMVLDGDLVPPVRGNRPIVKCGRGTALYAGEMVPVVRIKGQFRGERE